MALVILLMIMGGAVFAVTEELNHTKEAITIHAHMLDDVNNLSANLMHDYMVMNKYIFGMKNNSENQDLLERIDKIDEKREHILECLNEQIPYTNTGLEEQMIIINVQIAEMEEVFDKIVEEKENNSFNVTIAQEALDEIYDLEHAIFFGPNHEEDDYGLDFISLVLINKIDIMESEANTLM